MDSLFKSTLCVEHETVEIFFDRSYELQLCIDAVNAHDKTIIMGKRGVGKTALIKHVQNKILASDEKICPVYMNFVRLRPEINDSSLITASVLGDFVRYIWIHILQRDFMELFEDDIGNFDCRLAQYVYKTHKLLHSISTEIVKKKVYGAEASLFIKGNINSENEKKSALNPLTNQELRELFYGLCNQLIEYTDTASLAFLYDEANVFDRETQLQIGRELNSLFPSLSCSFVYVISTPLDHQKYDDYIIGFDRIIELNGFPDVSYSKQLLESRIIDKDKLIIDDSAIDTCHELTKGNPRFLIECTREAICRKAFFDKGVTQSAVITITKEDITKAWEYRSLMQRRFMQEINS